MKKNSFYLLTLAVVSIILLSSFAEPDGRFFGPTYESRGVSNSPDGSQCFEYFWRDYYVFGIKTGDDRSARQEVNCDNHDQKIGRMILE